MLKLKRKPRSIWTCQSCVIQGYHNSLDIYLCGKKGHIVVARNSMLEIEIEIVSKTESSRDYNIRRAEELDDGNLLDTLHNLGLLDKRCIVKATRRIFV